LGGTPENGRVVAPFTQKNIVAGANRHVIDFASSFGGALVLTNASFVVTIKKDIQELGGVQLWEGGPYWAECNVGATKPEEYGYYFWWGDTVGYKPSGGTLDKWGDYHDVTWVSSKGEQMGNSPFTASSCPTYGKDNAALLSAGYIDLTGNLAPAHDAATAHLGSPWRMPTKAEIDALVNNCTTTWTTKNGVYGRLVTGKGTYAVICPVDHKTYAKYTGNSCQWHDLILQKRKHAGFDKEPVIAPVIDRIAKTCPDKDQ
jgi:hypothetical protein